MQLGAFSVSLAVKDLQISKAFYEKLGFSDLGGNAEHGYLIMKNGDTVIGLFPVSYTHLTLPTKA